MEIALLTISLLATNIIFFVAVMRREASFSRLISALEILFEKYTVSQKDIIDTLIQAVLAKNLAELENIREAKKEREEIKKLAEETKTKEVSIKPPKRPKIVLETPDEKIKSLNEVLNS